MSPEPGRIVTFYSYKGGTGRSMALANFAWIMAASGHRVLVIDWDLEAPGLHRYFRPFLIDPDLFETDGLIDTFWSLASAQLARSRRTDEPRPTGDLEGAIEDTKRRLDWTFPTNGYIDFVGAGRQGATYSERVNTFDWKRFYELGGARILSDAKVRLRGQYEWVLIDSRTGVSDTSGISTMQLPDTVVACFTLNRQSIDGVRAVLGAIRNYRSPTVNGSTIKLFPVATRIENAEQTRLEVARGYARSTLAEFLPSGAQSDARAYWDKMELGYRPSYAFEEVLAAFGDATGATGASDTMAAQVEAMSQQIAGDDRLRMPEIIDKDRERVLAAYALGPSKDAAKKPSVESASDTTDTDFLRGVLAKEQLWRKSDFYWRYLLSRREVDLLSESDRKSFGRNMAYYYTNSTRAHGFLRTVDIVFGFVWFFTLTTWVLLVAAAVSTSTSPTAPQVVIPLAAFCLGALFIIAGLASVFVSRLSTKPYGFDLIDVFRLVLIGPVRSEMEDYESITQREARAMGAGSVPP